MRFVHSINDDRWMVRWFKEVHLHDWVLVGARLVGCQQEQVDRVPSARRDATSFLFVIDSASTVVSLNLAVSGLVIIVYRSLSAHYCTVYLGSICDILGTPSMRLLFAE